MITSLDCFFVGDRPYIQGSQIISHASELVSKTFGTKDVLLSEAKFTNITDKQVLASTSKQKDFEYIGEIEFSVDEQTQTIFLYSDNQAVSKRVEDGSPDYDEIKSIEKLNATVSFNHDEASLQKLLCSVIAANKKLHALLAETAHDIWFTGLRKGELPLNSVSIPSSGLIKFDHMFTAGKNPHQSMSRVSILTPDQDPIIPTFVITFAYKI